MPGSDAVETYAATVAARRTSGSAKRCPVIAVPAAPSSRDGEPVARGEDLVAQRELRRVGSGGGVAGPMWFCHAASLRSRAWEALG